MACLQREVSARESHGGESRIRAGPPGHPGLRRGEGKRRLPGQRRAAGLIGLAAVPGRLNYQPPHVTVTGLGDRAPRPSNWSTSFEVRRVRSTYRSIRTRLNPTWRGDGPQPTTAKNAARLWSAPAGGTLYLNPASILTNESDTMARRRHP
jgi:hypothetical protein